MVGEDLQLEELRTYSQKIRETFGIEEFGEIDYEALEAIPSEIERCRALLKYFIPDIFAPGKYDRRADIIDGCIYYLEWCKKRGQPKEITHLWAERAGFNRKKFRRDDVELDSYGYNQYHPFWHVLGDPNDPSRFLPRLVRYLQRFRGRRRKLDINDYSLIFFNIFHAVTGRTTKITQKMLNFINAIQDVVEQVPQGDALDLRGLMEAKGFVNAWTLLARLRRRMGFRILPLYERSVFDLSRLMILCPYPYHVQILRGGHLINQNFLVLGREFIQQIYTNIPINADWRSFSRKFPPKARFFRCSLIRSYHQSLLRYYDLTQQDWVIPWDSIQNEWVRFRESLQLDETELPVNYDYIEPTLETLTVCRLLEQESNIGNKKIHQWTKIPIEQIKEIRLELDKKALVCRTMWLLHSNLSEQTHIIIEGNEAWKYRILEKFAEIFPLHYHYRLEDLRAGTKSFLGIYFHSPRSGIPFLKLLFKIFKGLLHFNVYKAKHQASLVVDWVKEYFDPEKKRWVWNADAFDIRPLPRH